jgi:outer membrane protein TolC
MCPAMVPGEGYYDRIRVLEEAVASAEQALELAERAYRQGVD